MLRRAIGEYLGASTADVVTLQEVWMASDAALLAKLAAQGDLKYHHYFQGGIIGGELLTLSKHPIIEVSVPFTRPAYLLQIRCSHRSSGSVGLLDACKPDPLKQLIVNMHPSTYMCTPST